MLPDLPYHPMAVHFPLALLPIGFVVDLLGLILKKDWLLKAGLLLLVLGTLGAVASRQTGEEEEDAILETPAIEETLEEHEEGGNRTMWTFVVICAARLALASFRKLTPAAHAIVLVAWAAGLALLMWTAYHGGELVYKHGAGVTGYRSSSM